MVSDAISCLALLSAVLWILYYHCLVQCSGSVSFRASRIRIYLYGSGAFRQELKMRKNFYLYRFAISYLWSLISKCTFCISNSKKIRSKLRFVGILKVPEVKARSGSVIKWLGSAGIRIRNAKTESLRFRNFIYSSTKKKKGQYFLSLQFLTIKKWIIIRQVFCY